ncbi:hypothetical protein M513_02471 [Trichuris suis]|uniref:Glutamyl-tRNA(Gln) amidotransferase subunit A, mitochondrial n=1 Tax=Trichuris suis TaxID=68888 RepID=A0A085MHU8_9BILA|nr:hypothetical protein M513_02471 [Trichuris suis]
MGRSVFETIQECVILAQRLQKLNMFVTTTFGEALSGAALLDSSTTAKGSLFGIPFAVKDCFSTKKIGTTLGSLMLSNYTPSYNATLVDRLLHAGCILLGKTNMDEFSMGASSLKTRFGPVKNPWTLATDIASKIDHDWYIAGGSSGGSAAVVATGVAKLALGSDTGGSIRNPAALCGVVGFKPTYGLLSRYGLVPLVNSFDTPGILARKVDDICTVMRTISSWDCHDSTLARSSRGDFSINDPSSAKKLCVGIPKEFYPPGLAGDVLTFWKDVARLLERDGGCRLVEVSLPHTQFSIVCYHVLGESEIASNMARYDGIEYGYRPVGKTSFNNLLAAGRQKGFNEVVRRRILAGNFFLLKRNCKYFYEKAARIRRLITEEYKRVYSAGVDVLLLPATQGDAPLYSHYVVEDVQYTRERQDDFFTQPANLAGLPAIVIPVGLSSRKLPIGLQLIGDRFQDSLLMNIAKWLEDRIEFNFLPKKLLMNAT